MNEDGKLLQDCVEFLRRLKANHGLYSGRYGLNHTERAELSDLLDTAKERPCLRIA